MVFTFDGIHLNGKLATQHYTRSFLNVILDALPNFKTPKHMLLPSKSSDQKSYANVVKAQCVPTVPQPGSYNYSIPVMNRFSALGNM